MSSYTKINEKMDEMREEIIEAIRENVKIDSIKGEPEEGAPYGKGPRAALDNALALGEKLGFKTGNVGNRVGWIEFGEGEEMVGILGHLDVVPLGEGWKYPPFGAEIHDGVMYGRGVLDDKGPTIGAIFGMKAIRDLGLPIDRRIRVMFGTDEECGSSCVRYYIENGGELPTIGFTPDAEYPLIFCEKGMTGFEIIKKIEDQGNIKVVSLYGGTAANVVTPKCTLVVEGDIDIPETEGITVTKDGGRTTIEAVGVGAHGSTPHLGVNAAIKLFTAVKDIPFGGDFQKVINFLLQKLGTETNGKILNICYQDEETGETTVNLGVLKYENGIFSCTLDIRYPKNADAPTVVKNVTAAAEEYDLETVAGSSVPVLYVSKESELVQKLMKVYKAQTGRDDKPMAIGGGTYAKAFKNMVAFGPIFPGQPDGIHQPNECVSVDDLMKSLKVCAAAMYELAVK